MNSLNYDEVTSDAEQARTSKKPADLVQAVVMVAARCQFGIEPVVPAGVALDAVEDRLTVGHLLHPGFERCETLFDGHVDSLGQ